MSKLTDKPRIRYGKLTDLPWLHKEAPTGSKPITKFHIEQDQVIVAEFEKNLVGYIALTFLWWKIPFINYVYVKKENRRRGIGLSMLNYIEKELKEKGFDKVVGSAQANEPDSQIWHRKAGFKESGRVDDINEGDVGEVFFIKRL